jgi:hypothetical protein
MVLKRVSKQGLGYQDFDRELGYQNIDVGLDARMLGVATSASDTAL